MRSPSDTGGESGGAALTPAAARAFRDTALAVEGAVAASVVGQAEAVRGALLCLIAGGHALLEGAPGLGKTTMVRGFASALDLPYSRIQFTPDLMPADITGTTVLLEDAAGSPRLSFQPGPVFAGLVLADEINRASPRTQSALLEAMQEGTVTIAGVTHPLPQPFCVMATQNPVEMHGTYPLPEAELDRFFFKLRFEFPSQVELSRIVSETAGEPVPGARPQADAEQLRRMRALASRVRASGEILDYVCRLVLALQPGADAAAPVRDFVRLGPSPRGALTLSLAGRITALLDGRDHLAAEDIRAVALPGLRHRLVLSFDAERHAVTAEEIISDALARVPTRGA